MALLLHQFGLVRRWAHEYRNITIPQRQINHGVIDNRTKTTYGAIGCVCVPFCVARHYEMLMASPIDLYSMKWEIICYT